MNNIEQKIMVSVTVLTYNHEKYIKQALDSILMQKTSFPYEILIGDDGSTDHTPEIIKEYANQYPHIIRPILREKNIGASRNAYDLMVKARGKYLATCEGDDYWTDENKLQIQVDCLENNQNLIGCVHRVTVVNEDGTISPNQSISWVHYKPIFTLNDYQGIYLPGQLSSFVRRNIFLHPKYNYEEIYQAHKMVADRIGMFLYLTQGDISLIDCKMSCYRKIRSKNGENVTSTQFVNNPYRVLDEYDMLKKTEEFSYHVLQIPIFFEKRRYDLFADGLAQYLRGRGPENLWLAKSIFKEVTHKSLCVCNLFSFIFQKLKSKLRS